MIQEISIKRLFSEEVKKGEGDCTTPLTGRYFDINLNQNITLLTSYKVVYDRLDLLPHETMWTKLYRSANDEFILQWDNTPIGETETELKESKQKIKDKEEWVARLLQHCQIQNPENKNIQGSPKFILIDKRKKDINEFTLNNNKVAVFNMIKNMETDELMDVAFFSMMNPSKERLSTLQIFNRLCDLNTGILQKDAEKFLIDWRMPDATYQKVIRKAILLDVITSDKGIFKINNDIIGSGIDDLVAYMKSNTKIYDYIKSEVAAKDTLPYDVSEIKKVSDILCEKDVVKELKVDGRTKTDSQKADFKANRDKELTSDADELAKLKIRMREIGLKGFNSPFIKLETARMKVMEREIELSKEKKLQFA